MSTSSQFAAKQRLIGQPAPRFQFCQNFHNKWRLFKKLQQFQHFKPKQAGYDEGEYVNMLEEPEKDDLMMDFKMDHLTDEDLDKIPKSVLDFFSAGDTDDTVSIPIDHEIAAEVRNFVKSNRSFLPTDPRIEEESKKVLDQLIQMGMEDDDPELWQELALEAGTALQETCKSHFIQRMPYDVLDKIGETSVDYDRELDKNRGVARGRAYSDTDPKVYVDSVEDGEDLETDWEAASNLPENDSEIEEEEKEFGKEPLEKPSKEVLVTFTSRDLQPTFKDEEIDFEVVNFVNVMVGNSDYIEDEDHPQSSQMPPEGAIDIIGMGSWRLKPFMNDLFEALVANIEGTWRHMLGMGDLRLYPIQAKWKILDSLDPTNELKGESYQEIDFPAVGEEGYPRMLIENRFYTTVTFRKIHIEVAFRQDGVRILHVMMYPRPIYELPTFQLDVVEFQQRVSFMAMDFAPSNLDKTLPVEYTEMMKMLMNEHRLKPTPRDDMPAWAAEILSDYAVLFRPKYPFDVNAFVAYALGMLKVHMVMANAAPQLDEAVMQKREYEDEIGKYEYEMQLIEETDPIFRGPRYETEDGEFIEGEEQEGYVQGQEGEEESSDVKEEEDEITEAVQSEGEEFEKQEEQQAEQQEENDKIEGKLDSKEEEEEEEEPSQEDKDVQDTEQQQSQEEIEPSSEEEEEEEEEEEWEDFDAGPLEDVGSEKIELTDEEFQAVRQLEAEYAYYDKAIQVQAAHKRICEYHLKNTKTRRMLEASFGKELTDEYMSKVMFDYHDDGEAWQLERIKSFLDSWSKTELGVSQEEMEEGAKQMQQANSKK